MDVQRPAPAETMAYADLPHAFRIKGLRWWVAVLLMGITVVNYLDRTCLSVTAPALKSQLGIDEIQFSHIVMAFQIAYLVMQPLSGRLIDWLGLRAGLSLSVVWWSVAQMLTALAGGWMGLAAFRALLGVGEAANFPAAAKAVSIWFLPRERTLATGMINVGSGLGAVIAPPLVVYFVLTRGWQAAFLATGAIGIVWVTLWLFLYRSPEAQPWLSPEELTYIRRGQAELTGTEEATEGAGVWKAVLTRRDFWALSAARFLSEPAWQFFTYWIPLYLVAERGLNLKEIAQFAWMPFLAADVGCIFGGMLSPFFVRLGTSVMTARKLSASVCALLMSAAVLISKSPTAGYAVALFCVGAFAHQAMSSTLLTLPADLFPRRTVATANGLSGTIGGVGGMLFTMAVGIVAVKVGYTPLFIAIGSFDVIGAALLWALLREPSPGSRPSVAAFGIGPRKEK